MNNSDILHVKELNLNDISPNLETYKKTSSGTKLVVIGKPKTGKSTILNSILYNKRFLIPVAMVISGTEDFSGFYKQTIPNTFVYNEYKEEYLEKFVKRQKLATTYLPNPWASLIIDDCTDDASLIQRPIQQKLFKNGRHFQMLYILSLQYCMDIKPSIRTSIDGVFILREPNLKTRKSLYENYASIIPEFSLFCTLMDQITEDYTALYIQNMTSENDWRKCVFWYKATPPPKDFRFGCPEYWQFHQQRYNPEYIDPIY